MRSMKVIVDMQYGSCGKGLIAGKLALEHEPDTILTAWAPNAGHTFIDKDGTKYVHTALPNGIVSPKLRKILIGPGSVINPDQFFKEFYRYSDTLLRSVHVLIHPNAVVVSEHDREVEEKGRFTIGSTMKGVGEAMIRKIRREPLRPTIAKDFDILKQFVVTHKQYQDAIANSLVAIVEGAQGFSLGINQQFYPYCTSRECTKWQLFLDCGLPGSIGCPVEVIGVCRTYPIRVANRYDALGNMIGTSGPCYDDQEEISWGAVGVDPELTTVTKLPRRVFTWSNQQIRDAIAASGINTVFLNFCNYDQSANSTDIDGMIACAESEGASVAWLGYGPRVDQIKEVTTNV